MKMELLIREVGALVNQAQMAVTTERQAQLSSYKDSESTRVDFDSPVSWRLYRLSQIADQLATVHEVLKEARECSRSRAAP